MRNLPQVMLAGWLTVALANAFPCRVTAAEVVLCGYLTYPTFPKTNRSFAVYSAVMDSNRVERIRTIAETGAMQWTPERGFVVSSDYVLDLFVFDASASRVTTRYIVTLDHIGLRTPPWPWGPSQVKKSAPVLNTDPSAIRSLLQEVLAEFDQDHNWTRMALPTQVDISNATNQAARSDLREYLRVVVAEIPTSNPGVHVSGDKVRTLKPNTPGSVIRGPATPSSRSKDSREHRDP